MQQLNGKMKTAGGADSIKKQIRVMFPALSWVCGLLLAGSDGPWMPYVNVVGCLVFFGASIWLGRVLPRLETSRDFPEVSASPEKRFTRIRTGSQRVEPRYTRELGVVGMIGLTFKVK